MIPPEAKQQMIWGLSVVLDFLHYHALALPCRIEHWLPNMLSMTVFRVKLSMSKTVVIAHVKLGNYHLFLQVLQPLFYGSFVSRTWEIIAFSQEFTRAKATIWVQMIRYSAFSR